MVIYHQLILRRGTPEGRIFTGYYGFNANNTFQTIENLYAYPTYLRFGLFLGIFFWLNSFSQRVSEIYGNEKFIILRLESR